MAPHQTKCVWPLAYLTGTHPCATDVSFRRSGQEGRKGPGRKKANWERVAVAVRELMSTHRHWWGRTHNSSKAQGGMKAAEEDISEEGRGGEVTVGSQANTCTTAKTVQVCVRTRLTYALPPETKAQSTTSVGLARRELGNQRSERRVGAPVSPGGLDL